MNATTMSQEIKLDKGGTAKQVREARTTETASSATTLGQRLAICFAAGVLGALAVLLFSHVLSWFGLGAKGPIHFPASFKAPGIYRPLFWGGLGRLEPALPLWYPLLPRSNGRAVSVLPANGGRGVFRA